MRKTIIGLLGVFLLVACGTPDLDDASIPAPDDDVSASDAVESDIPFNPGPPPPLSNGTFTLLLPDSINESVLESGGAGDFSLFGALEEEGLIYLYFQNGGAIYYAISSDGSTWARSAEPIFTELFNDDFEHYPASIQTLNEGYAIYCGSETIDYAEHDYLYSVWILTAPEPTGPWTLREFPSLIGWHTGVEDNIPYYIAHPIVRSYLDGYRMYYAYTFTLEGIDNPGFATAHSLDGIIWRYTPDLPSDDMTPGTYPISLAEDYDWSGLLVLDVWPTSDGWQMLYLLDDDDGEAAQLYLADSEDGLQWVPSDVEIQIPEDQQVENIVTAYMVYNQSHYLLTFCAMPMPHQFECYIAANDSGL